MPLLIVFEGEIEIKRNYEYPVTAFYQLKNDAFEEKISTL